MQIFLNGDKKEIAAGFTTAKLVDELGLKDQRIAIEVNQELLVRSSFPMHVLKAGDRVEIIHAIGGG